LTFLWRKWNTENWGKHGKCAILIFAWRFFFLRVQYLKNEFNYPFFMRLGLKDK